MAKSNTESATALVERGQTGLIESLKSENASQGGLTSQDLEIPRVLILQALSPDVRDNPAVNRPGMVINSITKESLSGNFVPLFAFKQYAKFNKDTGELDWSTMDRNDPRVIDGLKWKDGDKPEVTEFINFLTIWNGDTSTPLILSFKRTSLRVGKQFLTLIALKSKNSAMYSSSYELSTKEQQDGAKSWYTPKVIPKAKVEGDLLSEYSSLAECFKPLVKNVKVEEAVVGDAQEAF